MCRLHPRQHVIQRVQLGFAFILARLHSWDRLQRGGSGTTPPERATASPTLLLDLETRLLSKSMVYGFKTYQKLS